MKYYFIIISLSLSSLILLSNCTPPNERKEDTTEEAKKPNNSVRIYSAQEVAIDKATYFQVVIPSIGCGSCLQEVEEFVLGQHPDFIGSIITNVISTKELSLQFSAELVERSLIDTDGEYLSVIQPDPAFPWLMLFDGNENFENFPITAKNSNEVLMFLTSRGIIYNHKAQATP